MDVRTEDNTGTEEIAAEFERALKDLGGSLTRALTRQDPPAASSESVQALAPDRLAALCDLDDQAHAIYAALCRPLLFGAPAARTVPPALIAKSQALFAALAGAFAGQATLSAEAGEAAAERRPGMARLAARAFCAMAEQLKWTAFEHVMPAGAFWNRMHALYRSVEGAGCAEAPVAIHPETRPVGLTCAEAYAQCLLLGTINVGILSPTQIEIAHRWLASFARSVPIARERDARQHLFLVDLAGDGSARRLTDDAAPAAAEARYLGLREVAAALADSRGRLYTGRPDLPIGSEQATALDYGTFLDLAERTWSPDWQRLGRAADRERVQGETLEAVLGLDRVYAALRAMAQGATAKDPGGRVVELPGRSTARWTLRDRSRTGIGATVPGTVGATLTVGSLLAFRASAQGRWELGMLVRRIASAASDDMLLGVKRLSQSPVPVVLRALAGETLDPRALQALYAPYETREGRIHVLVVDTSAFSACSDFALPVGDGAFRIHLNRILDRGQGWLRVGFEVIGKA